MELPQTVPFSNASESVFDQLLQQYSCHQIDQEESCHNMAPFNQQTPKQHMPQSNFWLMLDEVPLDNMVRNQEEMPQLENIEFKRVRSLREEQENKIAQFLREDRLGKAIQAAKNESPVGKGWQSLSPKKTKRIDKGRTVRAPQEYN